MYFARWQEELRTRFLPGFAIAAELEQQARELKLFALSLVPGPLQTKSYARAVFRAYLPNHTAEELDREVVIRTERAQVLTGPTNPVVWTLLDEAVLRRGVGGPQVMAEQLHRIADMAEGGRLRLHVLPFGTGAHALQQGLLTLMSFGESAPVAYSEGFHTGWLTTDPDAVRYSQTAFDLALSDALTHAESISLVRAAAKKHAHGQQ